MYHQSSVYRLLLVVGGWFFFHYRAVFFATALGPVKWMLHSPSIKEKYQTTMHTHYMGLYNSTGTTLVSIGTVLD